MHVFLLLFLLLRLYIVRNDENKDDQSISYKTGIYILYTYVCVYVCVCVD